jgi:type IV pilus assembly protein PilW
MLKSKNGRGFSLMEMMIGVFLSSLLISAITSLLGGSVSAYRLQLSLGQLEESGRYARDVLMTHITQAGYRPTPWQSQSQIPALTDETVDGNVSPGDQLGLQRWSDKNCYGTDNPNTDSNGQPAFYLLQTRLRVNSARNLAITCRYGPDASRLKTQINNYGLAENVESMQLLYAEDDNSDDILDGWVQAQAWQEENTVKAVRIALLLTTREVFTQAQQKRLQLLDETFVTPQDGHLRRVNTLTIAIRGRLK